MQSISLCLASCISFHFSSDKCAWNVHPTNNAQASFAIAPLHGCAFDRDLAAIHDPCILSSCPWPSFSSIFLP